MIRIAPLAVVLITLFAPVHAQRLRPNAVRSSKAVVYVEDESGKGKWRDTVLSVDSAGVRVGGELIPFARLGQVVYERRSASGAGIAGIVRVRHVLTLHLPPRDGTAGRFVALELGKDIAELKANRIQASSGIVVERRESVGS